MQNKIPFKHTVIVAAVITLTFFLSITLTGQNKEEILDTAKLKKKTLEFNISRDIFSPDTMKPKINQPVVRPKPPPPPVVKPPVKEEIDKEKEVEEEVQRILFYEGYVIKSTRNVALVSANGEFHAVVAGDIVLDRIKIIKIEKEFIVVEVDDKQIEIQIKGDDSNEK